MPEIVPALFALFALLLGVSLLMPLADRLSLPYTMLLAGFGLILGFAGTWVPPDTGLFGSTHPVADVLSGLGQLGLDTDAFLYIFLPPLLFAAGITVDLRLMLDEIGAVLVMAVVAVLVCIGFVGFALDAFAGFGLVVCLLLGAIVATTDPSAVLAIFGDIGAPRRLRVLVAGESLFNDAAAIALFAIFFEMLAGFRSPEFGRGVIAFLTDFIGGVALGYVLARGASSVLNYLREVAAGRDHGLGVARLSCLPAGGELSRRLRRHRRGHSGADHRHLRPGPPGAAGLARVVAGLGAARVLG